MNVNDEKKATLAFYGYAGGLPDAYRNYLLAETGLSEGVINDLEKRLLGSYGYSGHIQDMWRAYLENSGYSGSLDDMLLQFWSSGNGFVQIFIPLTHTAVPTRGSIVPTFTRATTETGQRWDEAGYLDFTALAGEMVFKGARRVRNIFTFTQEFDNAAWSKFRSSISANAITAPDGTLTADKLVEDGTAGATHFMQYNTVGTVGAVEVLSIHAKPAGRDWIYLQLGSSHSAYFNVSTGVVGTVTGAGAVTAVTLDDEGFYRCSLKATRSGSQINYVMTASADNTISYNGDGASGVYIWGAQLEDVTGQTTQTASEYCSVGVPSDWAGTDLVTNGDFSDGTTGWVSGNSSTLSVVGGKLRITNGAVSLGAAIQSIATVAGQKYVLYREFTAGTIATGLLQVGTTVSGNTLYAGSIVATSPLIIEFTATTATTYVQLYNGTTAIGGYADFDNVVVKPAAYHGSMVDGVACFDYYYLD